MKNFFSPSGKRLLYYFVTYCYRSIKESLKLFIARESFENDCEKWYSLVNMNGIEWFISWWNMEKICCKLKMVFWTTNKFCCYEDCKLVSAIQTPSKLLCRSHLPYNQESWLELALTWTKNHLLIDSFSQWLMNY